jgi:3-dehydroquinate dehydratase-1
MKPINLRGRPLNRNGLPLICIPLVARTAEDLQAELAAVLAKSPDVIEWRVDFFADIANASEVVQTARRLRTAAGQTPIIFTCRAANEGGERIPIAEDAVVALYEAVCASGAVDFIDYELSHAAANRTRLREASKTHAVGMIMSYHDFGGTPACDEIVEKLADASRQGADIAKVAVTPKSAGDVLVLLTATSIAGEQLSVPVITMSMGGIGAISRLGGWIFGSALTFAVGVGSSAPGQIDVDELRTGMDVLRRAISG